MRGRDRVKGEKDNARTVQNYTEWGGQTIGNKFMKTFGGQRTDLEGGGGGDKHRIAKDPQLKTNPRKLAENKGRVAKAKI